MTHLEALGEHKPLQIMSSWLVVFHGVIGYCTVSNSGSSGTNTAIWRIILKYYYPI